jgi:hypothetical protein
MNQRERDILEAVNAELDRRKVLPRKRFKPHKFFPMRRVLNCQLDQYRTARIWTEFRTLDVFTLEHPKTCWGSTVNVGTYERRGWLQRLAEAAADVVEGKLP